MGNTHEQSAPDLNAAEVTGAHNHPMNEVVAVCPVCSFNPDSEHLNPVVEVVAVRETWARTDTGGRLIEIDEYEKHAVNAVVAIKGDGDRLVLGAMVGFLKDGGPVLLGSARGEKDTIQPIIHDIPTNGALHARAVA